MITRSRTEFLLYVTGLLLLVLAASARAQSGEGAKKRGDPCLSKPECKSQYEQARKLSKAGQLDATLVAYQSAYALSEAPWLLVNIGRVQQKLGRLQQAIDSYRKYLQDPNGDDEELRKKTELYLDEAEQAVRANKGGGNGAVTSPDPAGGTQAALTTTQSAQSEARPVYKKWWFWTVIGVAGAAVAGGIAAGVILGKKEVPVYQPTFR